MMSAHDGAFRLRGGMGAFHAVLIAALLAVCCPGRALADDDKSYRHPVIDISIRLLPDGSAEVEEIRSFRFHGSFSHAFIERETEGDYGSYGIDFTGVEDADSGERLPMVKSRTAGAERIRWEYSARDETRRFRIRYRIFGAVQRYGDVAQFYWKVIEDRHASIDRVRIAIHAPSPSPDLFKVFVHSPARPGTLDFLDDFSVARIEQTGIGRRGHVEVRVLLDPAIFFDSPLLEGHSLEDLLADETRIVDAQRRRLRAQLAGLFVGAATLIAFMILYVVFFARFGREPAVPYARVYEREPPRDIPAVYVPTILTQGGVQTSEFHKSFTAAVLECARLGYLVIEETREKKFIFSHDGLRYVATEKGRALLHGGAVEPERGERALVPFEEDVLRIVILEAGDGAAATNDDIRKWAKKTRGGKTAFLSFLEPRAKELRRHFERRHFQLDDRRSARMRGWFVAIALAFAAIDISLFFAVMRHPALIAIGIAIGILGPLLSIPLARWTPEGALEEKRWKAFRRFMGDFSAMKEAGADMLPLWERYLVYATALGVADKLLDNLRDLATEMRAPIQPAVWFHPATASGAPGAQFASFEGIATTFASLQSLSSALSTSTSTGGGFSGGGGGGGGGGCSGAG